MASESMFGNAIEFLNMIGIYDVVLPFLLTFTIVYAIMEKTKIFGMEKVGEKEFTRKNLNAMVAFVLAFFVVASSQLVAVINQTMGQIILLLLMSIAFLMLAGSFHQEKKEGFFLEKGTWAYSAFMTIMFVGIILIFLNALGWLDIGYQFLSKNWNSSVVGAIIMLFLMGLFIAYITKSPGDGKKDEKKD